jgi:hypothetical protein
MVKSLMRIVKNTTNYLIEIASNIVSQIQREGKSEYNDFRLNKMKVKVEFDKLSF